MEIKIKFDRSIRREFKEQYGGLFERNVVSSIASIDGKTTEYTFDFGDVDAQGLANDILQVYKAADSCMRNLRIKRDMDYKIIIDDKPYYRVRAEDLLYVEEEVHND